jgi:DNA modification methylase
VNEIRFGDCREIMKALIAEGVKVQTCITSPPYFGLRDYGVDGQLGLESTPSEYVTHLVEAFRLVRDLLADDGTLWLNLGDSYAGSWGAQGRQGENGQMAGRSIVSARQIEAHPKRNGHTGTLREEGLKPKDLIGIPWRVAFALQADGWYLRSDIIWAKPNPMPESVTDRPTKSHEYIFLLSKSAEYFYDADAISEPVTDSTIERVSQVGLADQIGSFRVPGKTNGPMKAVIKSGDYGNGAGRNDGDRHPGGWCDRPTRNKRSVWTVATQPYAGAHFATFPTDLILPCVLAGSRPGDVVFDPFMGSGTTALVAKENGRRYLGCELNPEYRALWEERLAQEVLFGPEVTA